MKRICLWLAIGLLLCLPYACADTQGFILDENAVLQGMGDLSWAQGYAPTITGDTMTICLPIRSDAAKGSVTALLLADGGPTPFKEQTTQATVTRESGLYALTLKPRLLKNRENGDYRFIVRVTGQDANGLPLSTDFPVTIRIRDGRSPAQPPRPVWSGITAPLDLGEDCALTCTISNPSDRVCLMELTLNVSDASGDVLMLGSDKLPLPDLMPGEAREISVPLHVKPSAIIAMHSLCFTLTYTALDRRETWTETFTLPVTQAIRLEHGGAQTPATAMQGDVTTVTWQVMNMGRSDVRNVLVTLSLPGLAEQSVLVGTLGAGESKQAKLTFVPAKDALGDYAGTITAACEDTYGNAASISQQLSVTVEKAPELVLAAPAEVLAETVQSKLPPWLVWALMGACGVLLCNLIVQGAVLRKKVRRLEEERL